MKIPENITYDNLLQAIEKIDIEGIPNDGDSKYYDVLYNGKTYPPKLIVSYSNLFANGQILDRTDFRGGLNTESFNLLENNNFNIIPKTEPPNMSYFNELIKFVRQAEEGTLGTSTYLKNYLGLKVKVSFGQGNPARIPWIAFLNNTDTVTEGIYPVYLYFKEKKLLILAYGVSETNRPKRFWDINKEEKINKYFSENNLGVPERYGHSFVYKVYHDIKELTEEQINSDLNALIKIYTATNSMKIYSTFSSVFQYSNFNQSALNSGLYFPNGNILRFIASLLSKPFVILSGLSGSGKTKLAQTFAMWICESETQYKIVPVGADWTNREPLVGYPNGLNAEEYITPDSGVINLLMEAVKKVNENKPYFLILDEMNLSHVERYFADFLSIMESNDCIKLYTGNERSSLDGIPIPFEIGWPKNVFIIGTVNIDETTYMFSPKVLDRANVIEFRITEDEIRSFLENPGIQDLTKLTKQGVAMAESFMLIASLKNIEKNETIANELVSFFSQLQAAGAEFGYRSATEIMQLAAKLKMLEPSITDDKCLDIAIMQKLLPKLHGSRSKLVKILIALAGLCVEGITKEEFEKKFEEFYKNGFAGLTIKYHISFEKLIRMYKNVLANGFTSYAEA